jgi:hypothetical protein
VLLLRVQAAGEAVIAGVVGPGVGWDSQYLDASVRLCAAFLVEPSADLAAVIELLSDAGGVVYRHWWGMHGGPPPGGSL